MHEMSLCEGVIQVLEDSAKTQGFTRIKTVWLEIGALAGVEIEAMRFSFEAIKKAPWQKMPAWRSLIGRGRPGVCHVRKP